MDKLKQLAVIFFLIVTSLCILVAYRWIDIQSTAVLVIFDFLFVSIIFQLSSPTYKKVALLAVGNIVGMVWNYSFHALIYYAAEAFDPSALSILYTVSYPFLNSLWVISFWSLSLSTIGYQKTTWGKVF